MSKAQDKAKLVSKYQSLFDSPVGREVLLDILKSCDFHKPSFDESPTMTAYNEGRRSVALSLLRTLKINVAEYQKMLEKAYTGE